MDQIESVLGALLGKHKDHGRMHFGNGGRPTNWKGAEGTYDKRFLCPFLYWQKVAKICLWGWGVYMSPIPPHFHRPCHTRREPNNYKDSLPIYSFFFLSGANLGWL